MNAARPLPVPDAAIRSVSGDVAQVAARTKVLEVRSLEITLPSGAERVRAIDGLDLDVHEGEIVCLVGESGSGKSLTGDAIMGLLSGDVRITGGSIRLEGEELLGQSEQRLRALRGESMGMIFQNPMTALNPQQSIAWQIDEVLQLHTSLSRPERRSRALDVLHQVHLDDPAAVLDDCPHRLSAAQRQRVMIAMALVLHPRLIIADEPTTALDVSAQRQILELMRGIRRAHDTGILYVTHDFGVVAEIADRVMVLRHGVCVEEGSAHEVLDLPKHRHTRELISAVPSMLPPTPRERPKAPVVLEVSGLCKSFRRYGMLPGRIVSQVDAVKDVQFVLRAGETLGIVGESGSGKSTVSRCVTRLQSADAGRVMLKRRDLKKQRDLLAASPKLLRVMRRHIQLVYQDPTTAMNPRRSVLDLVAQGLRIHGASRAEAETTALEMLDLVELERAAAPRFLHEFSSGDQQRIALARALALKPRILVADEPVSALDVSVQAEILALIARLRERFGLSILFVTHDLRVAAQVCDRIAVMKRGEIVEVGLTAEVFAQPVHDYTRELIASIPGREWVPPLL